MTTAIAIKLRPYQRECKQRTLDALANHRSVLICMATGCGKTETFLDICASYPGRAVVMAHRDFLVRQPAERLAERGNRDWAIEMSDQFSDERSLHGGASIIFTSVQTMCRPKRYERFTPSEFGLLVIDEAHHAVSRTYRKVIDHFMRNESLRVLGVTATPKRADQLAMGQVFETVSFDYDIRTAIDDGFLVPVRQLAVQIEGLDFSEARTLAGDFSDSDLERIFTEEKSLHEVAGATVQHAGDLPTIVFCSTVNHARLLCAVLNRYKRNSAAFLSGDSDKEERRRTLAAYRHRDIQFLCNCMLFTEGFDAPDTACIIMARPTKSFALYAQMVGRGTRPQRGIVDELAEELPPLRRDAIKHSRKPSMLVLDFVGNSGRHKIITAADLLGGKYGESVRKYASKTQTEEAAPRDIDEALDRADKELAILNAMEARRKRIRARVAVRTRIVDPFGGMTTSDATAGPAYGVPATEGQIRYLAYLGVPRATSARYTKTQAGAVISSLKGARGDHG